MSGVVIMNVVNIFLMVLIYTGILCVILCLVFALCLYGAIKINNKKIAKVFTDIAEFSWKLLFLLLIGSSCSIIIIGSLYTARFVAMNIIIND